MNTREVSEIPTGPVPVPGGEGVQAYEAAPVTNGYARTQRVQQARPSPQNPIANGSHARPPPEPQAQARAEQALDYDPNEWTGTPSAPAPKTKTNGLDLDLQYDPNAWTGFVPRAAAAAANGNGNGGQARV